MASLRMRTCSFAQGCRIGASGLPISKMGCAPLSKNPELEEPCRVSRAGTGPGPNGGGMNGPGRAAQPTDGLGAKSGGEPVVAAPAAPPATTHAPMPIPANTIHFDMAVLPSCRRFTAGCRFPQLDVRKKISASCFRPEWADTAEPVLQGASHNTVENGPSVLEWPVMQPDAIGSFSRRQV